MWLRIISKSLPTNIHSNKWHLFPGSYNKTAERGSDAKCKIEQHCKASGKAAEQGRKLVQEGQCSRAKQGSRQGSRAHPTIASCGISKLIIEIIRRF